MQKNRLPEAFLEEMKELLGDEYDAYLASLDERPLSGLRVNTLKTSVEEMKEVFELNDPVPWTENGFYITEESRYTKHPFYTAGLYYIQEPSAMSSAALLGTKKGERILDLCAAPGGKTTQIGADLQGEGVLYANDLSSSRAKALLKNIELFGIGNAFITCEESSRLKTEFAGWFDRILVDAPCSGEGMFRKHPAVIRAWLEHGKDFYCPVQKMLLNDAAEMLKPGGTLLYSTCTYNRHEDEDQIEAFLASHPDFELDPIPLRPGFTDSFLLPGTLRLFPHKAAAEGHFVARMKKKGGSVPAPAASSYSFVSKKTKEKNAVSEELLDFLKAAGLPADPDRLLIQEEYVALLPEKNAYRKGLRYLRTGLLLGQLKTGRFKPSQALAMYLNEKNAPDPVRLSPDDPRVIRYLRGETIEADESGHKGWRLVLCGGHPLGFAKQDKDRLKNMLLPGWRMQ